MDLRKIKIADLVPASYNPRKTLKPGDKEYEKIKRSIEEFGYIASSWRWENSCCELVIIFYTTDWVFTGSFSFLAKNSNKNSTQT